jgi:hypothetical protein
MYGYVAANGTENEKNNSKFRSGIIIDRAVFIRVCVKSEI